VRHMWFMFFSSDLCAAEKIDGEQREHIAGVSHGRVTGAWAPLFFACVQYMNAALRKAPWLSQICSKREEIKHLTHQKFPMGIYAQKHRITLYLMGGELTLFLICALICLNAGELVSCSSGAKLTRGKRNSPLITLNASSAQNI
jgi:hypothetical protein